MIKRIIRNQEIYDKQKVGTPCTENPVKIFHCITIPLPLWYDEELSIQAKYVYGRMTFYSGNDNYCYPSQKTLAKEIFVSKSSIKRYLIELEQAGYIKRIRPVGKNRLMHKNNTYYLMFSNTFEKEKKANQKTQQEVSKKEVRKCQIEASEGAIKGLSKRTTDEPSERPSSDPSNISYRVGNLESNKSFSKEKHVSSKHGTIRKIVKQENKTTPLSSNTITKLIEYWNSKPNLVSHRLNKETKVIRMARINLKRLLDDNYSVKDITWFMDTYDACFENKGTKIFYNPENYRFSLPESIEFSDTEKFNIQQRGPGKKILKEVNSLFVEFFECGGIPKPFLHHIKEDSHGLVEALIEKRWDKYTKKFSPSQIGYEESTGGFIKKITKYVYDFCKNNKKNLLLAPESMSYVSHKVRAAYKDKADPSLLVHYLFKCIEGDTDQIYQLYYICNEKFFYSTLYSYLVENSLLIQQQEHRKLSSIPRDTDVPDQTDYSDVPYLEYSF